MYVDALVLSLCSSSRFVDDHEIHRDTTVKPYCTHLPSPLRTSTRLLYLPDRCPLQHTLYRLIANALVFTPEDDQTSIEIEFEPRQSRRPKLILHRRRHFRSVYNSEARSCSSSLSSILRYQHKLRHRERHPAVRKHHTRRLLLCRFQRRRKHQLW